MGKTALMLSWAQHALTFGTVGVISLEMSAHQLIERMAVAYASINADQVKRGNLNEDEWSRLVTATGNIASMPLHIDDTPNVTVTQIRAKARVWKKKDQLSILFIDYLQLMRGDRTGYRGNREQEIAEISRGLKTLAKELNIPVIALSQLSRAVEARADKRPMLSDLRESGAIEQDADMVMFLYRGEYYGFIEDEQGNSFNGVAEAIISKNRHGSLDNCVMRFEAQYTKFTDL